MPPTPASGAIQDQTKDSVIPLPSEEGTHSMVSRTLTRKPRPEFSRDWLICAEFKRVRASERESEEASKRASERVRE